MLKRISFVTITLLVLFPGWAFSNSGKFFNVTMQEGMLSVTTLIPGQTYNTAGIRLLTEGYAISNNTLSPGNGYFLFSVSDTQPALFTLTGPEGNLKLRACLNGVGNTYSCEEQTIAIPKLAPQLTEYHNTTGGGIGINLIPGLGVSGVNTVHFYGLPLLTPDTCDTETTTSTYTGIPITLHSDSLSSPTGFPEPCIAICNESITSTTYPGPSTLCTNAILVTP